MIDSHCHLNHPDFERDLPAVLVRAGAAGVTDLVVVGYDLPSSERAVTMAGQHAGLWAAVGVSPHDANMFSPRVEVALCRLAASPRVVAIGEIGLDYHYRTHPPGLQQQAYQRQLLLARELGLPAIVHDREAHDDILAALADRGPAPTVLHCYSGDVALAHQAAPLGCFFGVAGVVAFRNADDTRQTVAGLPHDRVLAETDCPYLAPPPHRGRRNEPAYLPLVVEGIAAAWGLPPADVAALSAANTRHLFTRMAAAG